MDQQKIGQFIKQIRIDNNLTQAELADKLNVTFQAVSRWENGKSIPDIAIIKEICSLFNVQMEELLSGEKSKKKFNALYVILPLLLVIIVVLGIIFWPDKGDLEHKKITSTCEDFTVVGSMAYTAGRNSIDIYDITYCGEDNDIHYKEIECTFYEKHENNNIIISSCSSDVTNVTITEFVENLTINVDDYASSCKELYNSELYLEINATDYNGKITTYKIPITLEDNC